MSFNLLQEINKSRMSGSISEIEFNYLKLRLGAIGQKFDEIVEEKRDEFENKDLDEQIEELQSFDDLTSDQLRSLDYEDVEENDLKCILQMKVTCDICNEDFEEESNDFSLQYSNELRNELRNFNDQGRMIGSRHNKVFKCFDCISDKITPFIDLFLEAGKPVILEQIVKLYLDECFSIQQKNEENERLEAQKLEAERLQKELEEKEKQSIVTIDRKNFIQQVRSNLTLNFS